ncbi:ligand-binding sensor domain-containing diguanylate cyclase [Rhodanobacter sp. Root561]|uniref:ligand-binding sensor domain-containing diguanylate cyclase n=1 Tax=Rhodanobacter sp. Root561 TaxID=1736560 RepID=UPI001F487425|nr:ligand-binding sensor domain-containing diguanylate cyclase [Rhodanobacter sp. Root561]
MTRSGRQLHCATLVGLLLCLLTAFAPVRASGTDPDPWSPFDAPWFSTLDIAEGIPHSTTTAVVQDRSGLIWIGTIGGLVRYDGYRIEVLGTRNNNSPGLPDNYVRSLYALPDGGLLIGTNAGGLVRFDPSDNSFKVYPVGPQGLSDHKVYAISSDRAGGVWVATEGGLDHLDLASGAIRRVDTGKATAARNFSVLQDRDGNVWLGNNSGLFVRHRGSAEFVRETPVDQDAGTVLGDQIWSILQDRAGRLWVGSVQAGAAWRDADGHWHGVPGFSGYANGARHPTVRDMLEVADDKVWIATDGNGVIEYTPGNTATHAIAHDPAVHSSLPGDSVRSLLLDRAGNLWVATDLGVARTHRGIHTAFSLLPSPLDPNALSTSNVRAIFVDSRARIWLGLGAGHIDIIDLKAGRMKHLLLAGSQIQRGVHSITEAADGSILVGTQGLARIDPDTLAIENSIVPELHDKPVLGLKPDGDRVVIGTYDGVYRYDPRTHALEHLGHRAGDPASLASNTVREIVRAGSEWWYATSRGISIARGNSLPTSFTNLLHRRGDPTSLPQDYISSLMAAADGRVWASTLGGLSVLHQQDDGTWSARTIGTGDGLSSDNVNTVLADDAGQIWASLSNGVARVDSQTLAVANLGARDGLHIASYVSIAAARAPTGELLFGGQAGLTVIRPHWQPPASALAPLVITRAEVNGVLVPFGKLPGDGGSIRLDGDTHNLRLNFALLDYQAAMETTYRYRLEGFDQSWTDIPKGSAPSANYTNLPHGSYRLRLVATTQGLQPRTAETQLTVLVSPYWYETTRTRIAAAILLLGLIVLLVHLRTLYLRHQARRLQREIDEHTQALLAANRRLDELASTDGLTGVFNRRRFLELVRTLSEKSPDGVACMALFDLDRFKLINDTHGHQAGDTVICQAVEVITRHCRHTDLIGRYGGEEFVLCLPDTHLQQAHEIIERIRVELAGMILVHDGSPVMVTASIGIAQRQPHEAFESWLSRTDKALYQAKRNGRNCCALAS